MKKINILVTGGGSPGISGTVFSLRNNYDNRDVNIVCTDAKKECVGMYLADKFYQIPKAKHEQKYLDELENIQSSIGTINNRLEK